MRNQRCPQYEALRLKYQAQVTNSSLFGVAKSLLNWVEDRRIDNYIFTTSPSSVSVVSPSPVPPSPSPSPRLVL